MNDPSSGAPGAEASLRAENMLARYPDITERDLTNLITWFKEATALDVGMVASNDHIREPYAQFRADHIDRLHWKDYLLFFGIALMLGIFALVIASR